MANQEIRADELGTQGDPPILPSATTQSTPLPVGDGQHFEGKLPIFVPLHQELEQLYSTRFDDLPAPLRARVREAYPGPAHWDGLSVEQRRLRARQCDALQDPLSRNDAQKVFGLLDERTSIQKRIERLMTMEPPPIPTELEAYERLLLTEKERLEQVGHEMEMLTGCSCAPAGDFPEPPPDVGPEVDAMGGAERVTQGLADIFDEAEANARGQPGPEPVSPNQEPQNHAVPHVRSEWLRGRASSMFPGVDLGGLHRGAKKQLHAAAAKERPDLFISADGFNRAWKAAGLKVANNGR